MEINPTQMQPELKRVLAGFLFVFLVVFLFSRLFESYLKFLEFRADAPQRTISISAEGKVDAAPDLATASFSVVTQGKRASVAQDENSKKMNDAIAFLKNLGIAEEDIKTTNYDLQPQYDYDRNVPSPQGVPYPIVGYLFTQTVTVKIHAFDKVGAALEGMVERGINQVSGVSFSIEDPDELKAQARAQAFAKAREKADSLVRQSGARIGRIVNISEGEAYTPYPYYAYGIGGGGPLEKTIAPEVQPGTQEVRVSVNVVFELF